MKIFAIIHLQGDSCCDLLVLSSEEKAIEEANKLAKRFGYEFVAGRFWKSDIGSVEVQECELDKIS